MERPNFKDAITELFDFFRLNFIEDAIDPWFNKLKHIPDEALPWIIEQFHELDNIPRNLPRQFIQYWYKWQKQNPNKVANEYSHCDDCDNHGYFIIKFIWPGHKTKTESLVKCAKCQNYYKKFRSKVIETEKGGLKTFSNIYEADRNQLEMEGKQIIFPPKFKDEFTKDDLKNRISELKDLGNGIFKNKDVNEIYNNGKNEPYRMINDLKSEYEDDIPF